MSFLSLINSTVLGLATLVVLVVIAALLAWLVGYLYARQQRFQDDLLTTFHRAGIGSDIRPTRSTPTGLTRPSAASSVSRQDQKAARWPNITLPRLSGLGVLKWLSLVVVVITIGAGGYYSYRWSQTDVVGFTEQATDTVQQLIEQISGEKAAPVAPTDSSSSPISTTQPATPAGPYGPIDHVQAAEGSPSTSPSQP